MSDTKLLNSSDITFVRVYREDYFEALDFAKTNKRIQARLEGLSGAGDVNLQADYYLSTDGLSGFWIYKGELGGVFSQAKGRGKSIVRAAILNCAYKLDCFAYLEDFYKTCGFVTYRREDNWTEGGPDVCFMSYAGRLER